MPKMLDCRRALVIALCAIILPELVPEECGWCLDECEELTLTWYEGDQASSTIIHVMCNEEEVEAEEAGPTAGKFQAETPCVVSTTCSYQPQTGFGLIGPHQQYRNWYNIPKGIFRLCFILLNNVYCIPTYVVWMFLLSPLRKVNPDVYWRIEGYFFHWLLAMVSLWSYTAGYDVVETGDDITECLDDRTLIIANHQSTADVPLLFACFNPKKQVLPNIMWIMDSLFKYTNFGVVSVLHKDFFIMSGKQKRDKSLQALAQHLLDTYVPLNRKWLVLFPEGGFLRKRKAVSHRYAEKMNLPKFENVSLPRVGAMHIIMETVGPKSTLNNNCNSVRNQVSKIPKIEWILDITIAYPKGWPIDLSHIVFGHREPCQTVLFYRLYPCKEVPEDSESMTKWLFQRWEEKEKMLENFYKTGEFSGEFCHNEMCPPKVVMQDYLRFLIIHIFFIASTYIHIQMFAAAYNYYNYLVY